MSTTLAWLVNPDRSQTPVTDEDLLWMARMVEGETGGNNANHGAAVIWTVMQRRVLGPKGRAMSLIEFMRAFSSPLWGEDRCAEGSKYHGTDACTDTARARRARIRTTAWDDLHDQAKNVTLKWAKGLVPNRIPGVVDFAHRSLDRPGLVRAFDISDNRFYARPTANGDTRNQTSFRNMQVIPIRTSVGDLLLATFPFGTIF